MNGIAPLAILAVVVVAAVAGAAVYLTSDFEGADVTGEFELRVRSC